MTSRVAAAAFAAIVALSPAAYAKAPPKVDLACSSQINEAEVRRLFAVEWSASPLSEQDHAHASQPSMLRVRCGSDGTTTRIQALADGGAALRTREVSLATVAARAQPRALALAMIELLFDVAGAPAPAPAPAPRAVEGGAARVPTAPITSSWKQRRLITLGGGATHGLGGFSPAPTVSLRTNWDGAGRVGFIADLRVAQQIARPSEGHISWTAMELLAAASVARTRSGWTVRGAVGPAFAWGRVDGAPADAGEVRGHQFWAITGAVAADASMSLRLYGRVWLDIALAAAWTVLPLNVRVDERIAARVAGVRATGRAGLGIAF